MLQATIAIGVLIILDGMLWLRPSIDDSDPMSGAVVR
jgi:hypothetical protein